MQRDERGQFQRPARRVPAPVVRGAVLSGVIAAVL
jgi:hypothetical protein